MWEDLATFNLTDKWQITSQVYAREFRFSHTLDTVNYSRRFATTALVSLSRVNGKPDIFKPQRIVAFTEPEIIKFPEPPKGWEYALAVKQVLLQNEKVVPWKLNIKMPIFNPQTTAPRANDLTIESVAVSTTDKIISAANSEYTGRSIVNESKSAFLYLQLKNPATLTNHYAKLGHKGVCEIPFGFSGDVRGFWDKADAAGYCAVYNFKE